MATESIQTQIRANIKTTLSTLVKDSDFHVTPDEVIQVDHFLRRWLDESADRIYMIRETSPDIEITEESTFKRVAREMTVFILVCERFDVDGWSPFNPVGTPPGTIRDRMIRDVQKKLYVDTKRGGLAIDTLVEQVERDLEEPAGWVCAEIPVIVKYYHTYTDP